MDNKKPWDRRKEMSERPRAHKAFLDYYNMGPSRTLDRLAQKYRDQAETGTGLPPTKRRATLAAWSSRYNWQDRVAEWQIEDERVWIEENRRAIKEMARRHAQIALVAQQLAVDKIQLTEPAELSVSQATHLLKTAVDIERMARGEPSDIIDLASGGQKINKIEIVVDDEE